MVVQELGQPVDQRLGHLGQRHPGDLAASSPATALGGSSTVTRKSRITKWCPSPILSAQPTSSPQRPRSRSPRAARDDRGVASVSPGSTRRRAPTTAPRRAPPPAARRSSRSSSTATRTDAHLGPRRRSAAITQSGRCTTIARATRPNDSKKFLVSRSPGSARLSTPKQPRARHQSMQVVHEHLADADRPGAGVDVDVVDHPQQPAVEQRLDPHHPVAHHRVVERPDGHLVVGRLEGRAQRGLPRRRPSLTAGPEDATLLPELLLGGGAGQSHHLGEVRVGRRAGRLLRRRARGRSGAAVIAGAGRSC